MRALAALAALALALPAGAMTSDGREFLEIAQKLEPVHCEKRKLRRAIALAAVERRAADEKRLRARFEELNRDPETERLEKRLGELERRMSDGKGGLVDPDDLSKISHFHRESFYRCE